MAAKPTNDPAWKLDGTRGALRRGPLSATVDLERPHLGVQQVREGGRQLAGHLLALRRHDEEKPQSSDPWPLPLADAYVRGDDLVAGYEPTDDWPYSLQLYWGANPLEGSDQLLGCLSLLVSVETHLLDTWPRITVASALRCTELLGFSPAAGTAERLQPGQAISATRGAGCVLYRLADASISYLEIMPPSDFSELVIRQTADDKMRAEWQLFSEFLEKGVIRRAGLQCAFLPREDDVHLAHRCCQAVESRPLPLTT